MTDQIPPTTKSRFTFQTFILLLLPIILLAGVIALFLNTGGGLDMDSPAPIENLSVERYHLARGHIELHVQNTGPAELTIAQIIVNEAVMPFEVSPSVTIPRLGTAVITVKYAWTEGEAYAVRVFTSNAVPFDVVIPVAFETPAPEAKTFWSFTLIGLYVGVIPIFLGILWLPALRALGKQWMTFLMAVTVGLLIFLGLDTLLEALEQAAEVPSTYQGIGLIGIGAVATYMLLEMIGGSKSSDRSESSQRLNIAWRIALGIGIHNLGEGLAIGAAYNVGEIALGTFLVVGFIIQNITDKLGLSKRDSSRIVESLFEIMKEQLSKGDTVKISGFGNFVVRDKKARKGRNPQTGSEMEIRARKVLTFKSSQILKKTLNGKGNE